MQKKKIQILDTEYIEKYDLVYWSVHIIDEDRTIRLAMRGREMLDGFGIQGDVKTEQMKNFLSGIKGKTLDWQTKARIKEDEVLKAKDEDGIYKEMKDLESDPFFEVQQDLEERKL